MNERHVATIGNIAENKEGKQECVNLEAFNFDFTHDQSLKNMEIIFFLRMEIWALVGGEKSVDDVLWHDRE